MPALPAPPWHTSHWLNVDTPLSLESLRGKVIMLHAFQMLCPGCVRHGIPQAQRVAAAFAGAPLVVVGLHTVFEHHVAMELPSLQAFVHEYRIRHPVAVDAADPRGGAIPQTMRAYGMEGTPTTVLIDGLGRVRRYVLGAHEDLLLGADLERLLSEVRAEGEP
jgi:thiol-disulfide isomerase/thioredoxin